MDFIPKTFSSLFASHSHITRDAKNTKSPSHFRFRLLPPVLTFNFSFHSILLFYVHISRTEIFCFSSCYSHVLEFGSFYLHFTYIRCRIRICEDGTLLWLHPAKARKVFSTRQQKTKALRQLKYFAVEII